jgi:hypothetical protein
MSGGLSFVAGSRPRLEADGDFILPEGRAAEDELYASRQINPMVASRFTILLGITRKA